MVRFFFRLWPCPFSLALKHVERVVIQVLVSERLVQDAMTPYKNFMCNLLADRKYSPLEYWASWDYISNWVVSGEV